MRTTMDIHDELLAEAIRATGIKEHTDLVHEGLRELVRRAHRGERHSYVDEHGWPVLKRESNEHTEITNAFVNRLREQAGE